MEKLIIRGGNRLVGTVKISGAKNAVLPLIAATLLGTSPSTLEHVPNLEDVHFCPGSQAFGCSSTV